MIFIYNTFNTISTEMQNKLKILRSQMIQRLSIALDNMITLTCRDEHAIFFIIISYHTYFYINYYFLNNEFV